MIHIMQNQYLWAREKLGIPIRKNMQKIPHYDDMSQLSANIKTWGLEFGFGQVGISGVFLKYAY